MTNKKINTEDAPMAVGPYSQGIVAGNMVFTAGEIPVNPATGEIPETFEEQTRLALDNLWAVLNAANVRKDHVANVTVYLTNIDDFSQMNVIYKDYFEEPFPARSCVAVKALPKGVKIMVSAVGIVEN